MTTSPVPAPVPTPVSPPSPRPVVTRVSSLPLVWIVPLIALALGGWLVLHTLHERGPEITVDFSDATGVEEGKTQLKHKGGTVGVVTAVAIKPDLSGVSLSVRLNKSAEAMAREGSRFWIARPQIGLSGVSGLDTLLTGVQLRVRPGTGERAAHFVGLDRAPPPEPSRRGRTFLLRGNRLGSLNAGSPVFYREVKVGVVEASRLDDDATAVVVRIRVENRYGDLVRSDTRFWNAGGFSFKVGLLGAELKNTSLESLVSGGIAFATPPPGKNGQLAPVAEEGAVFELQTDRDKEWLEWQPKIPIQPEESGPDQDPAPKDLAEAMKS